MESSESSNKKDLNHLQDPKYEKDSKDAAKK